MRPRQQLLKMQRIILRQLKTTVHRLQGDAPPELNRYYRAYKRETQNYQKVATKTELIKQAKKSDIIFGADFHPFAQSQKTHIRILRELVKAKKDIILALEAVDSVHQGAIQDYLAGDIDDTRFLKKIEYFTKWGFPWENYKILFEFARNHHVRVVGVNNSQQGSRDRGLQSRDRHSAKEISRLKRQNPESLIYVIYGDLHLASPHLPRLTKKFLDPYFPAAKFLTIFQNSESLYWKLAKRYLEEKVDVLKLGPSVYCVVNSPPWLKWRAYLDFLESSIETNAHAPKEATDYSDHLTDLIKMIKGVWDIKGEFSDFHLYLPGDTGLANYLQRQLSQKHFAKLERLIKAGRSFFIPAPALFYFSDFHVNHAAALAGQYIHAKLRHEKELRLDFPKDFVAAIWIEAMAFFASKVINHRRKFSTLADLPSREQVTLLVLEQRLREQIAVKTRQPLRALRKHKGYKTGDFQEASRILGSLLGNKLYLTFKNGQLDFETLHTWLKRSLSPNSEFLKFYSDVITTLRPVNAHEKSKNDRL